MFQYSLTGKDGSGSGFGSWKMVPAVPVPLLVSGKTVPTVPVPTVPVPGSGSVPEPPCYRKLAWSLLLTPEMLFFSFCLGWRLGLFLCLRFLRFCLQFLHRRQKRASKIKKMLREFGLK